MRQLRFTYEWPPDDTDVVSPGCEHPPWWPSAYSFLPDIYCSDLIRKHRRSLARKPDIPWERNIAEVWVESRRAYEILCRTKIPGNRDPLVRINMPDPEPTEPIEKLVDILIGCSDGLGTEIARRLEKAGYDVLVCHGTVAAEIVRAANIVIMPFGSCSNLFPLMEASAARCKIVTSDAGAAEEYLTLRYTPRSWHVVRRQRAGDYVEAVKDLLAVSNDFRQVFYQDEAMYADPYC